MSSWSRHCFVPRTFLAWHSYVMSSNFCRMSDSFIEICFSVSRDNVCGTFPSIMWLKTPYCHSCFRPLNFHIRATCFKFPQKIHSTKKGRVYEWQNAWWWHDMETLSALLTLCEGNPLPDSKVHGAHLGPTGPRWAPCWPHELCYLGWDRWFYHKGPVMWSFDVFFVVILNKLLNKQLSCWWFEILWAYYNDMLWNYFNYKQMKWWAK